MTNDDFIKATFLIAREKPGGDNDLSGLMLNKNITMIRVESGNEALRVFQSNPSISLAMIDAVLPGLNGFETILEIRKLSQTVPVILFVNYVNTDSMRLSILVGCTRMLQNPVDPYELDTIVNQYLIQPEVYPEPNYKLITNL